MNCGDHRRSLSQVAESRQILLLREYFQRMEFRLALESERRQAVALSPEGSTIRRREDFLKTFWGRFLAASLKFPDLALGNAMTVFQNLEPSCL
jgi:hypothetical protein